MSDEDRALEIRRQQEKKTADTVKRTERVIKQMAQTMAVSDDKAIERIVLFAFLNPQEFIPWAKSFSQNEERILASIDAKLKEMED